MIGFGWQAGNGKWVTNQIFFTDAQGGQAPVQPDVAAAEDNQTHQEVTAEVHHEEEVETQNEEEPEGAVGGQNVKEEDKEDEEDEEGDDDDAVDELITSGQIKLTASVKRVIGVSWQAGNVDLSHQVGNKVKLCFL